MNRSSGTLRSLWDGPRVHAQHVVSTERSFGITGAGNCIAGGNATALGHNQRLRLPNVLLFIAWKRKQVFLCFSDQLDLIFHPLSCLGCQIAYLAWHARRALTKPVFAGICVKK